MDLFPPPQGGTQAEEMKAQQSGGEAKRRGGWVVSNAGISSPELPRAELSSWELSLQGTEGKILPSVSLCACV